ncbi:Type I restriction-modification system methyltransferase subunit [Cupriavidus gilardii J11]|uniref:Type I restriction-modification system methyltransferase subunit n=1 Tax=Cupriavidus gilardii J11 TaxID=936133 RepID=A0A562BT04_9BURK|nr:N-6 DNA methylase [Cupriavidus gilardii]TWG87883.1 Type I restriction-modification system methyltransferase subunit [Cupriavidus gilardii J11]
MSRAAQRRHQATASHAHKELLSLMKAFGYRHSMNDVFADFVEMSALAISNAVDRHHFEAREKRYLEIAKKYDREELTRFPQMFGALTMTFEERVQQLVPNGDGLADVLGQTYMMLELGNDRAGQFFTPYTVSRMMAGISMTDGASSIERDGFVTVLEPASGAGGMVIACADALNDAGHNYQQRMHATCIDIDPRCVHMTYVQLALLHIPAIVVHGNALSGESWGSWFTPAHVLGGWGRRLRAARARKDAEVPALEAAATAEAEVCIVEPAVHGPARHLDDPVLRVFVPDDQLALF